MILRICLQIALVPLLIRAESSICTEPLTEPKCEAKLRGEKLTCRSGIQTLTAKEHTKAKIVHLCHWSDTSFSPYDFSEKFPKINKLSIKGGNLKYLLEDFPITSLEKLTLTELPLDFVQSSAFSNLRNLKVLDLTNNLLQDLDPAVIYNLPESTKVHLSGNPWQCTSSLFWMLNPVIQAKIVDMGKVECGAPYKGKPALSVLRFLQRMGGECPIFCTCTMTHIAWDLDRTFLHPVIEVNCSGTGLESFPDFLPTNTTTLYLNNNSITDISPLVNNPMYRKVLDVYLDNNRISTIDVFEGADWLKTFRVLSLKHNLVNKIPVYALDHGLDNNKNLGKIYLGGNPWACDCDFTPPLQHFLIKYQSIVRDSHEIKCQENSELSLMPVMEISLNVVCYEEEGGVNPLDVLSGFLAVLIVLLVGKLVYDYWTFKRTGKLPWIVAKMP